MGMADHHGLEGLPGLCNPIGDLLGVTVKHENVKENGFRVAAN
jgi:hypothetical protein